MNPLKKLSVLKRTLKVPGRKRILVIFYEYLIYKLTKPDLAEQYFIKLLFRKSVTRPSDYVVSHKIAEQAWYYKDTTYNSILNNKSNFELFFSKFNIPVVKSFAYNINHLFFGNNDLTLIVNSEKFRHFFIELKDKGSWKEDYMIVKKKDDSWGGRNIFKISFKDIMNSNGRLEAFYNEVINSGYIFQDRVVQHPELNRVSPYSLNTIRIDTFTNKDGITKIFNAYLRFSCKETITDNVSGGGMFSGINMENGMLYEEAFGDFHKGDNTVLLSHPLTGLVFKNFQIPFFQQAKKLAKEAAKFLPYTKLIGWDIGIQPTGPVLIEGNCYSNLFNTEIAQKGHLKNPVVQELLNELDVFYNKNGNRLDELKKRFPYHL